MADQRLEDLIISFLRDFNIVFDYDFSFTRMLIEVYDNENLFGCIDPCDPCNDMANLGHLYESYLKLSTYLKLKNNDPNLLLENPDLFGLPDN